MSEYISKNNLYHNYISLYKYKQLKEQYESRAELVENLKNYLQHKGLLSDYLDWMEEKDGETSKVSED